MSQLAYRTYRRTTNLTQRNKKVKLNFAKKFLYQLIISSVLMCFAFVIKNGHSNLTELIEHRIKSNISYDIHINKNSVKQIGGTLVKLKNSELNFKKFLSTFKGELPDENLKPVLGNYENVAVISPVRGDGGGTIDYSCYQERIQPHNTNLVNRGSKNERDFQRKEINFNKFITPVKGSLSSGFGNRVHPIKKNVYFHKGIDIEANLKDNIKASETGKVLEAKFDSTFGNYLKIQHNNDIITLYAHCSSLNVKIGQEVKKGDMIAKVGETGAASGPHLHFEVWKQNQPVNPLDYIKLND